MKTLIKLDCGKHYGNGGKCSKCVSGITNNDISKSRDRALLNAFSGPPIDDIQENAIRNARFGF